MNIIQLLKTIKNPRQIVQQFMNNNQNPMFNNLMQLANKGDTQSIENFARNMMKEQGRDFDKEFNKFMNIVKSQNQNNQG